ncbi:hypothetical protein RS030_203228 [Cryptosporidium xiaoi]|uniref:Uncharacterized protein n=1 Tax=Cryptosporidium xiaoi TaxID=659607 RepID=A0AAV9XZU1_9CRYT
MYVENQRKNGIIELELVHDIPKTERFDADINSPISYDDVFESISLNKSQSNKFNANLDIPNDLKVHLLDLLQLCGIDEFNDTKNNATEQSGNKNENDSLKNKHSNSKLYNIVPPFLSRLIKYNLYEKTFPNYFEFGSNLTLPSSFLVNKYRLLKPISPSENPWYKGCTKLILIGVPSFLSINEVKKIIIKLSNEKKHKTLLLKDKKQNVNISDNESSNNEYSKNDIIDINVGDRINNNVNDTEIKFEKNDNTNPDRYPKQDRINEFGILRYTNMFTTDNKDHYINNLYRSPNSIGKNRVNMALLEFSSEHEALNFWASLSTGSFESYGYVFTSIPDPSGLRIIVEGMLTVFSPKCIPLIESIKSVNETILNTDYSNMETKELKLIFPLIGSCTSFQSLKRYIENITSENRKDDDIDINITFDENNDLLIVISNNIKTIELLNNRIFQHSSFKVPIGLNSNIKMTDEDTNIVNVAMFLFDDKICEPVIIEGNYDIHPIKHKTIDLDIQEDKIENIKTTFSSSSNILDKDPEPAGFLFKKFEELREALKHDLDAENGTLSNTNDIEKLNVYNEKSNLTSRQHTSSSIDDLYNKEKSVNNKENDNKLNTTKTDEDYINCDNLKEYDKLKADTIHENSFSESSIENKNHDLSSDIDKHISEHDEKNVEIESNIGFYGDENNVAESENLKKTNSDKVDNIGVNEGSESSIDESIRMNNGGIEINMDKNECKTYERNNVDMTIEPKQNSDTEIQENSISKIGENKHAIKNNENEDKISLKAEKMDQERIIDVYEEIDIAGNNNECDEDTYDNKLSDDDYIEQEPSPPIETTRGRRGRKRKAQSSVRNEEKETSFNRGTSSRGRPRGGRGGSRATKTNKRRK